MNKQLVNDLIEKAKVKNCITTYSDFCNSQVAIDSALTTDEVAYYNNLKELKDAELQNR